MKMRWLAPILAFALVLFTLGSVEAQSSSKVYRFKRLDSDVSVQPNGDLQIVETQEYQYVQGSFTFGFRDIPTARLDRITNIGVSDDTRKYQPTDSTGIPFSFTTFTTDNGDLEIRWFYPATRNTSKTFNVAYTVVGGLRYYPDGDQLYWKPVFPTHYVTLESSRVTVHLPGTIAPSQLKVEAYTKGSPNGSVSKQIVNGNTVQFAANNIPDGDDVEVRVQFPHGIVSGTKPSWQAQADLVDQVK
ncbi:MAG: DUF2207 domain-containing protein, partial [Chloroflexi bacterium]